jgi:hypothetical protein
VARLKIPKDNTLCDATIAFWLVSSLVNSVANLIKQQHRDIEQLCPPLVPHLRGIANGRKTCWPTSVMECPPFARAYHSRDGQDRGRREYG